MTLKQLGLPTLEELEAMTDEQLVSHFSRYLVITRPPEGSIKASSKPTKKPKPEPAVLLERKSLEAMAAEMGFNIKL
jgi:hypothetical protein